MTTAQLVEEIISLPPNLREQALNFIAFLKTKAQTQQQPPLQKRQFGADKGLFTMSENFDEPLEDFKEHM